MKTTAVVTLWLSLILTLIYPLWGLLDPASYAKELADHYAYAEGVSDAQVRYSAAMLWISNSVMAFSFFALARCISGEDKLQHLSRAGVALVLYPFARILVEVWSGINLTSHTEDVEAAIQISSDKMFFIVFGLALLGISKAFSELHRTSEVQS